MIKPVIAFPSTVLQLPSLFHYGLQFSSFQIKTCQGIEFTSALLLKN